MPRQNVALTPRPGVVKSETDRVVEGRYTSTQMVRFEKGLPEKIGGWTKQTNAATSGIPRALHAWRDLDAIEYIAAGTYRKLYVYERNFEQHDITPLDASGTLTEDPFATTEDSSIVTVTHATHGRGSGDLVIFSGAEEVGGLTIDGEYVVVTVPNANTYTIDVGSTATSTDTGGGDSVTYEYEVGIGTERGAYGYGYGVGRYGLSTYGDARENSTIFIEPRIWTLDHFGKDLIAAFNGGSVYAWDPTDVPAWGRATVISDAPTDVRAIFVTPERFVFALREDMTVSWCSQGDYTTWTPAEANTANIRRLSEGTKLIAGRPLAQGVSLVWSDAALYVFQYTGSQFVFDSRLAGTNCGLIAPSAAVSVGGIAYWMGHDNFWLYSGSVRPIPNVDDIRAHVFDNLRTDYQYLCWAVYVPRFNEVWWLYVATGESDPGMYVIYSISDQAWAVGALERASATHFTHGDTRPYMGGTDGHIYLHEDGHDADGSPIAAHFTIAPMALDEGRELLDIDGFVADFHAQSGDVSLTVNAWDRLRDDSTMDTETETIGEGDSLIDLRLSGRYAGLTVSSNTLGGHFRLGKPVFSVQPAGSRR